MKPAAFIVFAAVLVGLAVSLAHSATIDRTGRSAPQSVVAALGACDAAKRVQLSKNGGTFAIPPCSGFTASINYPPALDGKAFRFLVTTSVTNNFGAPAPKSGTAIFYVQMPNDSKHHRDPVFQETGVTNTITSSQLLPSHTYTLTVYNLAETDQCQSAPCPPWTLNIGSPNPNTHSITFSSPLSGAIYGGVGYQAPVWQFIQN